MMLTQRSTSRLTLLKGEGVMQQTRFYPDHLTSDEVSSKRVLLLIRLLISSDYESLVRCGFVLSSLV